MTHAVGASPLDPRAPLRVGVSENDEDLIAERLEWTPRERLRYLLDMLEFEQRAHQARRVSSRVR